LAVVLPDLPIEPVQALKTIRQYERVRIADCVQARYGRRQ
jgi:hypothetical protein